MPQYLAPICNDQTFDANGDPLNGGQIETYLAGSSTPAATYTDESGLVQQSNPIILNSLGFPTLGAIWLTGGRKYKFIIKSALGVTLRTIDNIAGVNDASVSQSEWVESGLTPTYISAVSFSVPGDQTAILQINRRVRTTNTVGFVFSTITNSVFAAGVTTITLANDSGNLDAGLSAVAYAVLSATDPSVPGQYAKTLDVAKSIQEQQYTAFTTGGTTTAYTLTPTPAVAALVAGQRFRVKFNAANTTTGPTLAISGLAATAIKIYDGSGVKQNPGVGQLALNMLVDVEYDGTDMVLLNVPQRVLTVGAAIPTTSGANIDINGVFPSWARHIRLGHVGVSHNGTDPLRFQLGDSGGIENTGYSSNGLLAASGSAAAYAASTAGFDTGNPAANTFALHGIVEFISSDGLTWVCVGNLGNPGDGRFSTFGGSKTLSAALDRIRVTTPGGTNAFDAGFLIPSWQ